MKKIGVWFVVLAVMFLMVSASFAYNKVDVKAAIAAMRNGQELSSAQRIALEEFQHERQGESAELSREGRHAVSDEKYLAIFDQGENGSILSSRQLRYDKADVKAAIAAMMSDQELTFEQRTAYNEFQRVKHSMPFEPTQESYYTVSDEEYLDLLILEENGTKLSETQQSTMDTYNRERYYQEDNELDRVGGPDEFGYSFMDSDEEDGPVYSWIDLTIDENATMLIMTGTFDDSDSDPVDLPWDFPFYGETKTQFVMGSNGMIGLDGAGSYTSLSNQNLPSVSTPNDLIALFWDDLRPYDFEVSQIWYGSSSLNEEDVFVISYIDYQEYGFGGLVPDDAFSGQVVLYEDGRILLQYDYFGETIDLASATIGIENADGTTALMYGYNNALDMPADGSAVLFHTGELPDDRPEPNYFSDFEEDDGGLVSTVETGVVNFEWGAPLVAPYSGSNCWVTGIDMDYDNADYDRLETGQFTISSPDAYLSYWHIYEYEDYFDGYNVVVSTDEGLTWTVIEPENGYPEVEIYAFLEQFDEIQPGFTWELFEWTEVYFSLADYVDETIIIGWQSASDDWEDSSYPGLSIDDIAIYSGPAPPPEPNYFSDFEEDDGGLVSSVETGDVNFEWGAPLEAPYSGINCWVTGIDVDYDNADFDRLDTPAYAVTSDMAYMSYWHLYDYEGFGYDGYNVVVSIDAGETWEVIEPDIGYNQIEIYGIWEAFGLSQPGFGGAIFAWEQVTFDLSMYVEETIIIGWQSASDDWEGSSYPGLSLDDVAIYTGAAPLGWIEGSIWDDVLGEEFALEGVEVWAYSDIGVEFGPTFTDEGGSFFFEDLVVGMYTIDAYMDGFVPVEGFEVEVMANDAADAEFGMIPVLEATIEEIQGMELGVWVMTSGIVTVPNGIVSSSTFKSYIQDETGFGVMLFDFDIDLLGDENPMPGDELAVIGMVDEFGGITELVDFYIDVVSTGNPMPMPYMASTGDMATAHDMEGSWAEVYGQLTDDPGEGSYNIHLDDGSGEVSIRIYEAAGIDLSEFGTDDWVGFHGVIGMFNDEIQIYPTNQWDVFVRDPFAVENLEGVVDQGAATVTLTWDHEPPPPPQPPVELFYDEDDAVFAWSWVGNTMGVAFEPEGSCQVVGLKAWTSRGEEMYDFDFEVYGWDGDAPSTELSYTENVPMCEDQGWTMLDVADAGINFDGNFAVGFGSVADSAFMGYANVDNGHAWDLSGGAWSTYAATYFIRALVVYTDGTIAELAPIERQVPERVEEVKTSVELDPRDNVVTTDELDEFIEFIVYLGEDELTRTTEGIYVHDVSEIYGDNVLGYSVTALFDEGESAPIAIEVVWNNGLGENEALPEVFAIGSVYPNPFNPTVNVMIEVPARTNVSIEIFNINGQLVEVLQNGAMDAGFNRMAWHAQGTSGVYFMRVNAPAENFSEIRKLIFVK